MPTYTGKSGRIAVTGTGTSSTNNAADLSTDGVTLSINSTALRHWVNNTTSLKIFEGASTANDQIDSVNYVQGIVTLTAAASTSASWTIDVETVTSAFVAQGKSWTANMNTDVRDHTTFSTSATDAQWRTVKTGLSGGDVAISRLITTDTTGAAFFDRLAAGTETLVELWTDYGTREKLEAYAYVSDDGFTVPLDGDGDESVSLTINGQLYLSTA